MKTSEVRELVLDYFVNHAVRKMPTHNKKVLRKGISKNFHDNRLDLNVVFNKRKVFKANLIGCLHQKVRVKMI